MQNRSDRRATNAKIRTGAMALDYRLTRWLDAISPWSGRFRGMDKSPNELQMTNREVVALLIAKNGFKPKVTQWGKFAGPFGLEPPEAFLMMELIPYFQGIIDGSDLHTQSMFDKHLQPELNRLADEFDQWAVNEAASIAAAESANGDGPASVSDLQEGGDNSADSVERGDGGQNSDPTVGPGGEALNAPAAEVAEASA